MKTNDEAKAQYTFESLTPYTDSDLGIYESALDYVFEHPDIKNVALSGSYGAGKSSVLASYEKKPGKEKNYLHISLAHFTDESEEDSNDQVKESVLEGKILNQLIHQIPPSKIPQTNFRVKEATPKGAIIEFSIAFSLLVLLALHLTLSNIWETYIGTFPNGWIKNVLLISTTPYAYLISGLLLTGILVYAIYQIVRLQRDRRIFKKLNLQGNEIELFGDSTESYFDKYLNEVLYLFENANADVIVFEDMDRFNATQIFERLREVNTLINLKTDKRIIRFFYLLKDDIFTSKDRTKFFDFIIPIVPVVDGSNSYDQFITHLQKNNLLDKFDERFLKGLSLYVDEMRLLKNICNEFLVYYNRLNTTELDYNKMLALITYKNLFPRDFSELQLGQGFVHALFEHKEAFVLGEKKALEQEIADLETLIQKIQNEALESASEIDIVYNTKRNKTAYYNHRELARLDTEEADRKRVIEEKKAGKVDQYLQIVVEKKEALSKLEAKSLHEIINRENIDNIFQINERNEIGESIQFLDVKANAYFPLLKFLIRNGYIDETYSDYMTYFYENSLSRTDKIFLRSVTDRKTRGFQYELKEPQKVIEQLDVFDFNQEEILNYNLIDYLLKTDPGSEYIRHLILQLKDQKRFDFLSSYLAVSKEPIDFVHQCNLNWSGLFQLLLTDSILPPEQLNQFALYTLYGSDTSAMSAVNIENCLTNFISASTMFLSVDAPKVTCIIEGLRFLGVSFSKLTYSTSNKDLFKSVYDESMYVISYDNLREVLMNIHNIKDEELLRHSNYSVLLLVGEAPIYKYVAANMETYVSEYLEFCDGIITDENDAAIALLNNSEVTRDQELRYIECLKNPLHEIKLVEDKSLWKSIIEKSAIVFTEENAIEYFIHSNKADQIFAKLINSSGEAIDFKETVNLYEIDTIDKFFDAIVACDDIESVKYEQCVVSLKGYYDSFEVKGLSVDKVQILVDHNIIRMSVDSLTFLRTNYPSTIPSYISAHVNEYIDLINEDTFDYSEMIQVIGMNIDDDQKIRLMKNTKEYISVLGKNYSVKICVYILSNNLCNADMPTLFEKYESYPPEIQSIIFNYAKANPGELQRSIEYCSNKLVNDLFSGSFIPNDTKVSILASLLPLIEREDAVRFLSNLGLDEYIRIFDPHSKPKFPITAANEELLEAFKEKGWISEYVEDPNREGFYKIRRRPANRLTAAMKQ